MDVYLEAFFFFFFPLNSGPLNLKSSVCPYFILSGTYPSLGAWWFCFFWGCGGVVAVVWFQVVVEAFLSKKKKRKKIQIKITITTK